MKKILVKLKERSYDILVGAPLRELGQSLSLLLPGKKVMVVTNPKVGRLYAKEAEKSLTKAGFEVIKVVIPDGERYKSHRSVQKIYIQCVKHGFNRSSTVVALGGGVIGDLAGFAAATFLRGIHFIQVPTTLLAQVDSSIGGKVGINLSSGKNLVGAFYQPRLVFADLEVLKTLSEKDFANGLSEVIKYGVIYDQSLFSFIEKNIEALIKRELGVLEKIISTCCRIKAVVVSRDERESHLRAILNFGHTIGHALEGVSGYKTYTHGEAVSIGMVGACKIAGELGIADHSIEMRVKNLLEKVGLPVRIEGICLAWDRFFDFLQRDKKALEGKIRFVLPTKIGQVKLVESVPLTLVEKTMKSLVSKS